MNLTHLSLCNCTRAVPPPLTNDQRMQALRACLPVQFANAFFTDLLRAVDYYKDQQPSALDTYDPE